MFFLESYPYFYGVEKNHPSSNWWNKKSFPLSNVSVLRQVLLARVYTQSCSFGISYVARPKKTEPAAGGGVPWSFLFSLDGFWWFVGCWTCVGSKTQKLISERKCVSLRHMAANVGLKQHANWLFWRFCIVALKVGGDDGIWFAYIC